MVLVLMVLLVTEGTCTQWLEFSLVGWRPG